MKTKSLGVFLSLVLLSALNALALTRYVNASNPTPASPYTSWATAATNIQSAIDAATAGDSILVTNGVYQTGGRVVYGSLTNRVVINKAVTVQSVNGPTVTVIKGYRVPGVTNGNGAVRCVYLTNGASLSGFTLTNGATRTAGDVGQERSGGGVWSESTNNQILDCVVAGNSAAYRGGGAYRGTLNNCLLVGNSAGSGGGGAYGGTLNNCTLAGNLASAYGGGVHLGTLNNCIVYFNTAATGSNYYGSTLNYCCTTPMPAGGIGNITNSPLFMDQAGGNLRLQATSPCVNAGNNSYVNGSTDLDGNPRISGGTVDMGAYEFQGTPPLITIQPANLTISVSGSATFSVTASGTVPLGYFWRRNGTPIAGANSSNYTTNNVQLADSGSQFSCLVSNTYGTALSSNAVLIVSSLPLTHYVSLNSTNPVVPYLSWATAATNIQDAIDAATAGDLILVSNGVYATGMRVATGTTTNRVAVTKPVTVQSVNGPALTTIRGESSSHIPCVYLTNGTVLSGFTLTNGYGGVWCESTNAMITNSVIINCTFGEGGGAYYGTLNNCTLTGNSAGYGGGAMYSTLNNCTLTGNTAVYDGGGADGCTLNNCLLTGNYTTSEMVEALYPFGGGAYECTLNNCVLTGNSANAGGGSCFSTLNNCTLVGNYPYGIRDGEEIIYGPGGSYLDALNNCIVYYNANGDYFATSGSLNYCCAPGGSITNAPRFVDLANGNLRLQSNSPCINAGNNSYVTGSTDLDGNPRIFGGTVDIGAYEFQGPGNVGFVAWLQQYGLPTDGSADYADPDGDGLNNWQEWCAGTVPTNAASVLKMVAASNTVSGVMVCWQSVTNRSYFLQRSTNLGVTPAFSTIQTNIAGQAGTTSYTDTTAANGGPNFYRIGVQLAP